MRKTKEVLRLKYEYRLSAREIARSCNVPRSTVADYLMKAQAARLSWSEASTLTDTQIEERLFPTRSIPSSVKRPEPDYEHVYNELRKYRKFNLTLIQLWLEYKEDHPDGYQYSQFCDGYRRWKGKLDSDVWTSGLMQPPQNGAQQLHNGEASHFRDRWRQVD